MFSSTTKPLTLPFFSVLHWALFDSEQRWPYLVAAGPIYGLGFGIMGALLGRFDSQAKSRHSLSLLYSLTSTSISFLIGAGWLVIFRGQHWWEVAIAAAFTLISIALMWFCNRGRIKGMSKQELFR